MIQTCALESKNCVLFKIHNPVQTTTILEIKNWQDYEFIMILYQEDVEMAKSDKFMVEMSSSQSKDAKMPGK